MALRLALFAVLVFLAGNVNAASLATANSKAQNCSAADSFKAIGCVLRMGNFINMLDELDMDEPEELKEFKKSCTSLQTCFSSLTCSSPAEKSMSDFLKSHCDAMIYFSEGFAECGDKLEKKNSECFVSWDPFPSVAESGTEVKEADKKAACSNIFGKNNCMKKEIVDECGEAKWLDFKKNFATFGKVLNGCDLEHI